MANVTSAERLKKLWEDGEKAKEEFENTVYVHHCFLANGAVITITATKDRQEGRKALYPRLSQWGYRIKDFDEYWGGTIGKVITCYFFLKPGVQAKLEEKDDMDYSAIDPTELQDDGSFFGFTEIPDYDWDSEDEEATSEFDES